ncbi:MAG: AAA family ATPase [Gemmatimonadales bacterium]
MNTPDPLAELDILVRSRYGIILLDTADASEADTILRGLATRQSLALWMWSRHAGLRRIGGDGALAKDTQHPLAALQYLTLAGAEGLFVFPVHEPWLDDAGVASALHEAGVMLGQRRGAVVLVGDAVKLPPSLARHSATIPIASPTPDQYRDLLRRVVRDLQPKMQLSPENTTTLLQELRGLTREEARRILTRVILDDGLLAPHDILKVSAAKRQSVLQESLLEYYPAEESLADVAGLAQLKAWLASRQAVVNDPARAAQFHLPFPRGILLLGVPGCGKSLTAKAVAKGWGLPLVRLDASRLYNKYVGETERNLHRAFRAAERVAPTVLWIDEIEKAFAIDGGSDDGGLSLRLLGSFLSWLQERKESVFVVATANEIQRIPPELLRKGRFDEVFFVDLPSAEERAAIFRLQLTRRGQALDAFSPEALAAATEGWSGAEIEQAVVGALYACLSARAPLSDLSLLQEIERTQPLSVTMQERIAELRRWAHGRTVPAS